MNASVGKAVIAQAVEQESASGDAAGKDYVGMWYEARRRQGVDHNMWFGFYEPGEPTPEWKRTSHRYCDGIGALSLLLKEKGFDCGPLPVSRQSGQPHWREVWRRREPLSTVPPGIHWHHLDAGQQHSPSHAPVSLVLSPEQTRQIDQVAAAAGVSTTMWLLWTADRATRSTMADSHSVMSWVFPVNLRGVVACAEPTMNHCSGLMVSIADVTSPADLKQQVSTRFARHEHWRQWFNLTVGRYIGQWGINLLYRFVKGHPGKHAGSYSNLGEWNVPGLEAIACSAPGSPAYPVAVSTVLCNGRRTLACRLHPVIGGSSVKAIELLTLWRELACTTDSLSGW